MTKRISKSKRNAMRLKREVKPARRGPRELTKSWANHFSNQQYSVEALTGHLKSLAKQGSCCDCAI